MVAEVGACGAGWPVDVGGLDASIGAAFPAGPGGGAMRWSALLGGWAGGDALSVSARFGWRMRGAAPRSEGRRAGPRLGRGGRDEAGDALSVGLGWRARGTARRLRTGAPPSEGRRTDPRPGPGARRTDPSEGGRGVPVWVAPSVVRGPVLGRAGPHRRVGGGGGARSWQVRAGRTGDRSARSRRGRARGTPRARWSPRGHCPPPADPRGAEGARLGACSLCSTRTRGTARRRC
jgi:hypothetical protein